MSTYRSKEEVREGFESYDDRFAAMVPDGAKLERHCTGMEWAEGPVYFAQGDYVLWSDIPNDRVMRWSAAHGCSVYLQPAGYHNGHYLDRQGRLVSCEHGERRISRTEADGTVVTLADRYRGMRLNSPKYLSAVLYPAAIKAAATPFTVALQRGKGGILSWAATLVARSFNKCRLAATEAWFEAA